ncbi:thiol reductant ABC exporter subunit CydC [Chthonobacter albigriseus]|uniref:thiol reductant ABC exporter subunit CydC n=1 Tax=Chthonobacter albigriseus TaxID=1683161 RepID=UPI0015EE4BF3|nr:thiol reductant ABC exporter subunit CydC [Chthonobacter albigriseus]
MRPVLLLVRRFARMAPRRLAVALALLVLTLAAGLGLLAVSGWLIAGAGLAGIGLIVFDTFQPSAGIRFFAVARTVLRYGERLVSHDATFRILAALRVDVFRGLATAGRSRLRSADLLARLSSDLDALDGLHLRFAAPIAAATVVLAAAAAVFAAVSPLLAVAVIGPVVLLGIGAPFALGLAARNDARLRHVGLDAVRARLVDLDVGRTELVLAGRLAEAVDRVGAAAARVATVERRLQVRDAGLRFAAGIAGQVAIAGAALVGAALLAEGRLSAPAYVLVVTAAFALGETIAPLRTAALELGRLTLAARRIAPLVEAGRTSAGTSEDQVVGGMNQAKSGSSVRAPGIRFDQVAFAWEDYRGPVLAGITLAVAPGERVALVGASGSGKSTILALAAGLVRPTAGAVTVGGAAVVRPGLGAAGHRIGLLAQRVELFRETVSEAVRLGRPEASEAEVADALALAGLGADLQKALGDGGSGLSGGERRRLAMARLLASGPDLVLLDEATEGLDPDTAAGLIDRLAAFFEGRTVLIATHLADEALLADRLVLVRDGRLVEEARRGDPAYDRIVSGLVRRRG